MNVDGEDLLRRLRRDFLDVHAARGGGDQRDASALAIQRQRYIDLPLDLRAGFDVHSLDRQAFGARLLRDQPGSQHRLRGRAHGVQVARDFDAARLTASTRMHLRLDDPNGSAKCFGRLDGLLGARRHASRGNGNPVVSKDILGLILVQIHRTASFAGRAGPATHAKRAFSRKSPALATQCPRWAIGELDRFSSSRTVVQSPPPEACGRTDTISESCR